MTENTAPENPQAPAEDDPRFAFAQIVDALGTLIEATPADALGNATPCAEFNVEGLLSHCVLVVERVAALGNGTLWDDLPLETVNAGWGEAYRAGGHAIMQAWADPAKLGQMFEVPWGNLPGGALMHSYSGELAVHGWDLAQATGLDFAVTDDMLQGAFMAAKFIPAEGRDDPDMPFGPVVHVAEDAPVLEQMAGWMGRQVNEVSGG